MLTLTEFVLSHLPAAPARVLEVGCGAGELALDIAAAGHEVVAVDPNAPEGPIFRRVRLEALSAGERFDAVVAARSLHHLENLDANLERIAAMLGSGGPLVVDEFGWDLFDAPTADWYDGQRRALRAAGREPRGPEAADWRAHHDDTHRVHTFSTLVDALRSRFDARAFEHVPYLWRYLGGEQSLALEETLVAAGAIRAIGFRFVGIPTAPVR